MEDLDRLDIRACLAGDQDAYKRIVLRHQVDLAKLMWRFSRNKGIAEELVQETFVQAFFSLPKYRGDGSFAGWLNRIGTRVGYRFWKQQAKHNAHYQLNDDDLIEAPRDIDKIDAEEAGKILHWLLDKLNEPERLVLTLMYFDDCSTEEIAQRMGWTRGMVKMRAYRARNRLRAIAESQGLWEKLGWIH